MSPSAVPVPSSTFTELIDTGPTVLPPASFTAIPCAPWLSANSTPSTWPAPLTTPRPPRSIVFPDATLRVLLAAGPEERAARRALEREGIRPPEVEAAIASRDELDARNVPPLHADLEVDSTHLDADEVLSLVLREVRERIGGRS